MLQAIARAIRSLFEASPSTANKPAAHPATPAYPSMDEEVELFIENSQFPGHMPDATSL